MKIGLIREEKFPPDKRVVFSPEQCNYIISNYPEFELVVQSSDQRCFADDEYIHHGIKIVNDVSDCNILLGIKEVPKSLLIANKTYFYFSHTIKKQSYNRDLLRKMIDLNIKMVDYEVLKDYNGKRLLGFGRYAGIVGAYNAFLTYGLKSRNYQLKPAHKCIDKLEIKKHLSSINFNSERIIVTGSGRVAQGVLEVMKTANITQVSKEEFINKKYNSPIFVNLQTMDYNQKIDGTVPSKKEFYANPSLYESCFMKYAKYADIFIAGHYYSSGSPFLYTRDNILSKNFNIKVVADISCDINGPVASTIRSSNIENPIYGYNPITQTEDDFMKDGVIAVMAVDNLPCELSKDASEDFGKQFIDKVLSNLSSYRDNKIIKNATICEGGKLTDNFLYLKDYIN
tara:strand:+ start:771 stop:1967 length:1197 start_codon:yes stop_codon:yes gene_type:complete